MYCKLCSTARMQDLEAIYSYILLKRPEWLDTDMTRLLVQLAKMDNCFSTFWWHSLVKVAACYQNIGKQSSILASVNESLVSYILIRRACDMVS